VKYHFKDKGMRSLWEKKTRRTNGEKEKMQKGKKLHNFIQNYLKTNGAARDQSVPANRGKEPEEIRGKEKGKPEKK